MADILGQLGAVLRSDRLSSLELISCLRHKGKPSDKKCKEAMDNVYFISIVKVFNNKKLP